MLGIGAVLGDILQLSVKLLSRTNPDHSKQNGNNLMFLGQPSTISSTDQYRFATQGLGTTGQDNRLVAGV
ncbi:hypothetical protein TNCV_427751 [Trichonephila clavipes]|nr:hypothetical protein TNCV_427751 [Trichonephila clavipes]